jgi:tetratricopeptide (TPR) repeat protein
VAPGWSFYDRDYSAIAANAVEKAVELDENQSMAWAVKSYLRHEDESGRDYNDTLAYLDKALETNPKNATAALWRGLAKSELAYHEDAIEDFELCLRIDPAYGNCKFHLSNTLAMIGRTREAVKLTKELFRQGFAGIRAANVQMLINMDEQLAAYALAAQRSDHPDYPREEWLDALEYPERDHSKGLAKAIRYLEQEKFVGLKESLLLAFGAYDLLEVDIHYPQSWIWTSGYPEFRKSAGFKRLVAELNLQAYWREHGFPPQCRPVGEEGFECD